MERTIYDIRVDGTAPLLQHNVASMLIAPKSKTRAESELTPSDKAARGVYKDGDLFVHPTVAFRNAILSGGKEIKIGRSTAAKYLAGALRVEPNPAVPLLDAKGKNLKEYDVHTAVVVNPSTGGKMVMGWPKWNDWHANLKLSIFDALWPADEDALFRAIEFAGMLIGIGDGRPEKRKLAFGTFEAVKLGVQQVS